MRWRRIKLAVNVLAFAAPALAMALALLTAMAMSTVSSHPSSPLWLLALLLQAPGLIADRWYFFAQAKHPQNLYYQVVS